jgi:hypothetical protein
LADLDSGSDDSISLPNRAESIGQYQFLIAQDCQRSRRKDGTAPFCLVDENAMLLVLKKMASLLWRTRFATNRNHAVNGLQ